LANQIFVTSLQQPLQARDFSPPNTFLPIPCNPRVFFKCVILEAFPHGTAIAFLSL